jgi:hypothetical protein
MTIVQQAVAWYSERKEYLSTVLLRTQISSTDPSGPDGEVGIGLESRTVIASVTIWNTGLIRIPALVKASGTDFILDDKVLARDEDLFALLDHYVEQIASPQ